MQEMIKPLNEFYDKFKQLVDKLHQPKDDYSCEWFKKGLLAWIQQGIIIRGVKTLPNILIVASDINRELGVINKT